MAVVIDLSRMPSHGKYVGAWLRGSKSTRHIPLVFVGGEAEKVAAIKKQMPDAVYASVAGIGAALKKAIAQSAARSGGAAADDGDRAGADGGAEDGDSRRESWWG